MGLDPVYLKLSSICHSYTHVSIQIWVLAVHCFTACSMHYCFTSHVSHFYPSEMQRMIIDKGIIKRDPSTVFSKIMCCFSMSGNVQIQQIQNRKWLPLYILTNNI